MKMILVVIFIVAFAVITITASAAPVGPTIINAGASERKSDASPIEVQAQAGNVTSLTITATRITQRWQGYYGNITGAVTLDDASNNTLYRWDIPSPEGEIYASNGSNVNWNNIDCINFTTNTSVLQYNISDLNSFVGLGSPDEQAQPDSVNSTFNQTYGNDGSTFTVGTRTINNADNCSMVTLFANDAYQTTNFKEVLLTDNESIIFAALLERDATGFSGSTLDFEMIVGVNGTKAGTTRPYYFYVELS